MFIVWSIKDEVFMIKANWWNVYPNFVSQILSLFVQKVWTGIYHMQKQIINLHKEIKELVY